MSTSYTLTGNIRDLVGDLAAHSAQAYLTSNLGDMALVDLDLNRIRLSGTVRIQLAADGAFSESLIATNSTGTNIGDGSLRYRVTVAYKDASGNRQSWDSGYFELTGNLDLSDAVAMAYLEPTFTVNADDIVAGLIATPGTATATALTAEFAPGGTAGNLTASDVDTQADARIDALVPGLVAQHAPKPVLPVFRRDPATIVTNFQTGHGWTLAGSGATWSEDTAVKVFGDRSAKVVTGSGASATATITGLTAIDGTARTFRAWLRCADFAKCDRVVLLASSDPTFASYFNITYDINFFTEAQRPWKTGEWVPVEFSWVKATTVGTPNRNAITALRLLVAGEAGQQATVNLNRVDHVPTVGPYPDGVVTLGFDDSWIDAYTVALPRTSIYGLPCDLFPITERIDGGVDYLTSAQVEEMVTTHGWVVNGHADTYANHVAWNTMDQTARLAMLNAIQAWNRERGFNSPVFAYPNVQFTAAATDDVQQFFSVARGGGPYDHGQLQIPGLPLRVASTGVGLGTTSTANVQASITKAKAEKTWLHLMFHRILPSGAAANDINVSDFDAILSTVVSSGIAVATTQDVLRAGVA